MTRRTSSGTVPQEEWGVRGQEAEHHRPRPRLCLCCGGQQGQNETKSIAIAKDVSGVGVVGNEGPLPVPKGATVLSGRREEPLASWKFETLDPAGTYCPLRVREAPPPTHHPPLVQWSQSPAARAATTEEEPVPQTQSLHVSRQQPTEYTPMPKYASASETSWSALPPPAPPPTPIERSSQSGPGTPPSWQMTFSPDLGGVPPSASSNLRTNPLTGPQQEEESTGSTKRVVGSRAGQTSSTEYKTVGEPTTLFSWDWWSSGQLRRKKDKHGNPIPDDGKPGEDEGPMPEAGPAGSPPPRSRMGEGEDPTDQAGGGGPVGEPPQGQIKQSKPYPKVFWMRHPSDEYGTLTIIRKNGQKYVLRIPVSTFQQEPVSVHTGVMALIVGFVVICLALYFFIIRPRQLRQQETLPPPPPPRDK